MTTIILSKPARLLFSIIFLVVMLQSLALAQVAGKLTKVSGRVDLLRAGATSAATATVNEEVSIGDIVRTKSDGTAEITFIDKSIMTMGPRSRLGIEEYLYNSKENKRVVSLKLQRGRAGFTVPKPVYAAAGSKFEMQTKTAVAGVRGTEGLLLTGPIERVYVKEGVVEFKNSLGAVTVKAGNVGEVLYGRVPLVRPYSSSEVKKQEEDIKAAKPAEKQSATGKTPITAEAAPAVESAAAAPSTPAPAPAPAAATAPQPVITPNLTPPITPVEATQTIIKPTTPVNINPIFPGTTTINIR